MSCEGLPAETVCLSTPPPHVHCGPSRWPPSTARPGRCGRSGRRSMRRQLAFDGGCVGVSTGRVRGWFGGADIRLRMTWSGCASSAYGSGAVSSGRVGRRRSWRRSGVFGLEGAFFRRRALRRRHRSILARCARHAARGAVPWVGFPLRWPPDPPSSSAYGKAIAGRFRSVRKGSGASGGGFLAMSMFAASG